MIDSTFNLLSWLKQKLIILWDMLGLTKYSWYYQTPQTKYDNFTVDINEDDFDYESKIYGIDEDEARFDEPQNTSLIEEQLDMMLKTKVAYTKMGNIVRIYLPKDSSRVGLMNVLNTEPADEVKFLIVGNTTSAVSKITIARQTIEITCSHVIQLFDDDALEGFSDINPMLCCKSHKLIDNLYDFKIREGDKVMWYTRGATTAKHAFIETTVYDVITLPVRHFKRQVLMSVAFVVALKPDDVYITSGTLMLVKDRPYIVVYRMTNMKDVLYLVAVAPLLHEYRFQIE